MPNVFRRPRRRTVLALTGLLAAASLVLPAAAAHAATACRVEYTRAWDNGSGFGAAITITNLGDPLTAWTLGFAFGGDQRVTNGWSGTWSQAGSAVTVRNAAWNGNLPADSSTMIGFNGSYSGSNADPSAFTLNGTACTGQPPVTPQLVVSPTAVTVPEGATAAYTVRLSAAPSGPVTVTSVPEPGDTEHHRGGGGFAHVHRADVVERPDGDAGRGGATPTRSTARGRSR